MRRFFIDRKAINGKRVIIGGEEAHHIRDVIRLKSGDRFLGFDGTGRNYNLRIKKVSSSAVEAEIEKISENSAERPRILLACALPRKSRMDYIVEKATELGASEIIPIITERTVVKVNYKNKTTKQRRWQRIALEASKQCGRDILPKIYGIMKFRDAVKLAEDLGYKKRLLACFDEDRKDLNQVFSTDIKEIAIFIGPEGGLSDNEVSYARNCGLELVSLGGLVLRVDTACIFSLSVIQALAIGANK